MPKNRQLPEKNPTEGVVTPSYEHYTGMNDTIMPRGGDALRLALAEQLQAINLELKSAAPNLYTLEAKSNLELIGREIDQFDEIADPEAKRAAYEGIAANLASTQQYTDMARKLLADEKVQNSMARVRPLDAPEKATLILPAGDDIRGQTIH